MKNKMIKSFMILTLAIGISSFAIAQKPPRANATPKSETIEKIVSISGKVNDWTYNDDFIYDGFYLQSNNEKLLVKFPKHLGKELKSSINNNNITVNGVIKFSPTGEKEIDFVSINSNGKAIYNIPAEKPEAPLSEKFISNSGKISQFQQNDKGEIIGLILDNNIILRIPKHKASELSSLAPVGSSISFTGIEKAKKEGEAYINTYSIIKCNTITINGDQYLVK